MDKIHDFMHNPRKMAQMKEQTENMPKFVAEKMSRTYASWLQWWRSTITSDDYMKYLSTTVSSTLFDICYVNKRLHVFDSFVHVKRKIFVVNLFSNTCSSICLTPSVTYLLHVQYIYCGLVEKNFFFKFEIVIKLI